MAPRKTSTRKSAPGTASNRSSANGPRARKAKAASESGALPFPVVGIGASAGGLEAFIQLLQAIPPDTGMAFVLISHLSPKHESALTEILARKTTLPVTEVSDEPAIEPNHVYVIPPGRAMTMHGGRLRLSPRDNSHAPYQAVDQFFESLAHHQGHQSIGVILSGSATDGTLGLEEIKVRGGITFAQDDSAQYSSMPRSAIAAGIVDFVLAPAAIAAELTRIAGHPYISPQAPSEGWAQSTSVAKILRLLQNATGVEFTNYKQNTLQRRILRRMVLRKVDALEDYVTLLQDDAAELQSLFQDILINVTGFFRDPQAFDELIKKALPKILEKLARHDALRAWVLGCSTGEEAYSLAIVIAEQLEKVGRIQPVQIFATDLNSVGIDKARAGFYSAAIAETVSPERLRRFFTESDGGYRVNKQLRDMVVFARHNALVDPPFTRMDLVSCRNVLIYFDSALQQRLIPLVHYALKPAGILWLGSSETVGGYRDHFNVLDARHRIYSRKSEGLRTTPPLVPGGHIRAVARETAGRSAREVNVLPLDAQREADRILLSRYTPPAVLVNSELEILQFRGDTGHYLAPVSGKASLNLLKMLREGLPMPVRRAITKAKKEGAPVREETIPVQSKGEIREVDVEVMPVPGSSASDECYLVLFDDSRTGVSKGTRGAAKRKRASRESGIAGQRELNRLTHELSATREYLQSVIEQHEASSEELQSANEEIQSANEELQSINEELETSKEEIQSTNEELATLNEELQNRNVELSHSNNDLLNLLASVQISIVMLGRDLRIRRFTPTAERMLNVIASDIGRPIGDIRLNMNIPDLEAETLAVVTSERPIQRELQDSRGKWYSLRIRPYRTVESKVDGAVLVFVDIDSLKRSSDELRESEQRFRILADSAPVLIWVNDHSGRIFVNKAYLQFLGVSEEQIQGTGWTRYIHPDDRQTYLASFADAVAHGKPVESMYRFLRSDGEYRWMKSVGVPRQMVAGEAAGYVGSSIDVTDLKEAEESLRAADRSKNEFLAILAHELRNPLAPLRNATEILRSAECTAQDMTWVGEMLDRQIGQLTHLVDDLLDVSRITQGKIRLHRRNVRLRAAVERALESQQKVFAGKNQRVTAVLSSVDIVVDADPLRLEQILGNLLSNASKFTPADGEIVVSTRLARMGANAHGRKYDGGDSCARLRCGH